MSFVGWLRNALVVVLVPLLLVLGCAVALLGLRIGPRLEEGLSAVVGLIVTAALVVQILMFHQLSRMLKRLEESVRTMGTAPDPRSPISRPGGPPSAGGTAPVPASFPPPHSIKGSSSKPQARGHKTPPPSGNPRVPQSAPPPPYEVPFCDPVADLERTQNERERLERESAVGEPRASAECWALAGDREGEGSANAAKAVLLDPVEIGAAWNSYLINGNGRFDAKGLREFLVAAGIEAEVLPPDDFVGLGAPLLGVAAPGSHDRVLLLPDFTRPPRALAQWFELDSEIRNATRMNRLVRVAELRRSGSSYELRQPGVIE